MGAGLKRIARVTRDAGGVCAAVACHAELAALLRAQLSPAVAAMFAKPKQVDNGIEWYSELGGQPVHHGELLPEQATTLMRLLEERLQSIRQLAARLETQGADGMRQAQLLRQVARNPDPAGLYSLNGQPVLTNWEPQASASGGSAQATAQPVRIPDAAAQVASVPSAIPAPMIVADASGESARRWPWLVVLLALLAVGLGWWLWPRPVNPLQKLELDLLAAGQDCARLEALSGHPVLKTGGAGAEAVGGRLAALVGQHCRKSPLLPVNLLGEWEDTRPTNRWRIRVVWNESKQHFEGVLIKNGVDSAAAGFAIDELVWTATPQGKSTVFTEVQKYRSMLDLTEEMGDSGWQTATFDLSRSSEERLMTGQSVFTRICETKSIHTTPNSIPACP